MTGLTNEQTREALAAEYVLGTLDARGSAAVEADMRGDAALRQAVQAWEKRLIGLADLVPSTPAPAGSWEALEAAVDRTPRGMRNLFDDTGVWEPLRPGLARKLLWNDNTFLLRVDPGATIPGHLHPTVEHCVVVRGRMVVAGESFGPGDYQGVQAGVPHPDIAAPDGLLLLIRRGD